MTDEAARVLVVCAHADDEAYGLAGVIARHAAAGDRVRLLFLADGVTARQPAYDPSAMAREQEERRAMAREAARILGAQPPRFLDLPDNRLDTVPLLDIVKAVEAEIDAARPEIVYTNHAGDLNVDHRVAHQAVLTACRPLQGSTVRAIHAFETLSSSEWSPAVQPFTPTRFVDIGGHTAAKLAAIRAYDREMRSFPHPRSVEAVEALWRLRGAAAGLAAAEALVVVREIV